MAKDTYETVLCNEYMDKYGYPKLTDYPAIRNTDEWLDKHGKDVGVEIGCRECWIDEKFSTANLNREKTEGHFFTILRYLGGIKPVPGVVTANPHTEVMTDVWVVGIPYGKNIENISKMEIYAARCETVRENITVTLSISMSDLMDQAMDMHNKGITLRVLGKGFRIGYETDKETGEPIYSLFIPYRVFEEIGGFHGWV